MKDHVIVKSYRNGISLLLDQETPLTELLDEIAFKFHESGRFFSDSKMALSLEGRNLSQQEEIDIVEAIKENCDINIVCLVGHDDLMEDTYLKAVQRMDEQQNNLQQDGQFYKGTLKNHEILETESSIVVLGDVYPGSKIISSKNIIVLGGLYGEAYAGGNGDESHFVVALEMEPEMIKIGDFKYITNEKGNKWPIKLKVRPKVAFVKNNKIVIEPLTKETLKMI